jgi:hypothetical protein
LQNQKKWNQWSVFAVEVKGKALECDRIGLGFRAPSSSFSKSPPYRVSEAHHRNNSLKNTINFKLGPLSQAEHTFQYMQF